ncbi:hypothetical protein [Lewinella sp. W8]|uniref:hypothetical protein n=1 Tax=Lewinella sp. W8 TaxID=2528208 RepID=UPI001067F7EE|nr:hypothetical protein [Lewinella sp. W8]MTB50768.1 hypothetical protein [Lewinella sp. W8]
MVRPFILILLVPLLFGGLNAQRQSPEIGGKPDPQSVYLDSLFDAHQYFRDQESGILLRSGYHSPEHLALLDSIRQRDRELREDVEAFLVTYGFPAAPPPRKMDANYRELMMEFVKTPPGDSLRRDSLLRVMQSRYQRPPRRLDHRNTILLILDTEPDFSLRCQMISYLKEEWNLGHLPTAALLIYLRHTYRMQWGEELPIAEGSSEEERLLMYARELSGCW